MSMRRPLRAVGGDHTHITALLRGLLVVLELRTAYRTGGGFDARMRFLTVALSAQARTRMHQAQAWRPEAELKIRRTRQ